MAFHEGAVDEEHGDYYNPNYNQQAPPTNKKIQYKISKEARETVQECVTEFLLFVTSEANEICAIDNRKTLSGEDIIKAMDKLGFDDYKDLTWYYYKKFKQVSKISCEKKRIPLPGDEARVGSHSIVPSALI